MKNTFLFCLFVLLMSSCGPDMFYHQEKDIKDAQWSYRDTADFHFNIQDTSVLYNLFVDFSYADTFPNQNLYLKLSTRFPDGKRLSKPCSFDLFNPQGATNGKCSGGKCNIRVQLQENAFFDQVGAYCITLEQFMRQDPVQGVTAVGLAIEKSANKRGAKK